MSKKCENRYRDCRKNAGLTIPEASTLLGICERSISAYESGETIPKDDIVALMADTYHAPLLVWWHVKTNSVFGKFFPDLQLPLTDGDMVFQMILTEDDIGKAVSISKRLMSDGVIDESEEEEHEYSIGIVKKVYEKAASVLAYADQRKADQKNGRKNPPHGV